MKANVELYSAENQKRGEGVARIAASLGAYANPNFRQGIDRFASIRSGSPVVESTGAATLTGLRARKRWRLHTGFVGSSNDAKGGMT